MKKLLMPIAAMLVFGAMFLSSCTRKIADLNMVSNRNVNFKEDYIELSRHKQATTWRFYTLLRLIRIGKPTVENSIDKIIEKNGQGEFLTNATISTTNYWFVLFSLSGIKVEGDIYGINKNKQEQSNSNEKKTSSGSPAENKVNSNNPPQKIENKGFELGEKVNVKYKNRNVEAIITELKEVTVKVKWHSTWDGDHNEEFYYSELKKIETTK